MMIRFLSYTLEITGWDHMVFDENLQAVSDFLR